MKCKALSTLAGMALFIAVTGSALAAPGDRSPFQIFATLSTTADCGGNVANCSRNVFTVPSGRRLEITSVSCGIISGSQTIELLSLTLNVVDSGNLLGAEHLLPVFRGTSGIGSHWASNNLTLLRVAQKRVVELELSTDQINFFDANCKIAGEFVQL